MSKKHLTFHLKSSIQFMKYSNNYFHSVPIRIGSYIYIYLVLCMFYVQVSICTINLCPQVVTKSPDCQHIPVCIIYHLSIYSGLGPFMVTIETGNKQVKNSKQENFQEKHTVL